MLIEAALAKLPIITTDAGSNLELIEDGMTGTIVPQRDSKALANAIKNHFERGADGEMIEKLYSRAREIFGQDATVGRLVELLK